MTNIKYSNEVNEEDWKHVLNNSKHANIFHSTEYFNIARQDGHELLYACCYKDNTPIAIISGILNKTGYHDGIIEVGTKSGGYPLATDNLNNMPNCDDIKNNFVEYFANTYLAKNKFLFYPCTSMAKCVLDLPEWNCNKQYDPIALLDLTPNIDEIWQNLKINCRNAVRFAKKKDVTCRIANKKKHLELFYKYYSELRSRLNTKYMSFEELEKRFDVLTKNNLADLWGAFSRNIPLAYAFIWKFKKHINFVYGTSNPETLSLKPNNLLQWEIISFYKNAGYNSYNMWGVRNMNLDQNTPAKNSTTIEGYGKFKLSFGSKLTPIARFKNNKVAQASLPAI